MKKFYIILPVVLIALFAIIYQRDREAAAEREVALAAEKAKLLEEEQIKKDAEAKKAREDAEQRAAERDAEQAKKEAERLAKWEADLSTI